MRFIDRISPNIRRTTVNYAWLSRGLIERFPGLIRSWFITAVIIIVSLSSISADPIGIPSIKNTNEKTNFFNISGEVGTYGEVYTISGRENRRPSSTGRLFFKPAISIMENFTINFNLFMSTEGNNARQDINQIDINPKWGWGEAHLIDFTESYSSFTLNGIKIRGASLNLTPGKFRASVISGATRTEVSSSAGNIVYKRNINGGKIGFGKEAHSYFDLIVISVRDDFAPSEMEIPDTTVNGDSTGQAGTQNPESITPQENLVGALVANLTFADKKISWKNELSGSAITRDRRSIEWEQKGYPEFLKNFFIPRLSSGFDGAFSSDIKLNSNQNNLAVSYQYIGPGYISLGLASQAPDRQAIKLRLNRRFREGALKLDLSRQNDNLIKQKRFTTVRNTVNTGFLYKPVEIWNFNLNVTLMTMNNDAADSSANVDFTNWVFRLNNALAFKRKVGMTGVSLDYSYQTAGDTNPARVNSELRSHTTAARATFNIRNDINITPSVNIVNNRQAEAGWNTTQSYAADLNVLTLNKKLNSGIQLGISFDKSATSFKSGIRSNYKLTSNAIISLRLELRNVRSDNESGGFDELTSRLTLTNRF
jgi:hypothetical protein